MSSSGILSCVALERIDVSEARIASIMKVTFGELETTLALASS
jgi:hypothetical protein